MAFKKGSKFKINNTIYEVKSSQIETKLHTTYGNYIPDIIINTVCGKIFYVEVAYTNKKTDEYILKWDELHTDVIEIDVNSQLGCVKSNDIPTFNLIYSSNTAQCLIKRYIRQDYDELISERKFYWKRNDLINYKIKWEKLDWFWRDLQNYYRGKISITEICETFENIDFEDQKFICTRFKNGKHKTLKYELEKHYTNKSVLEKVHLQHISKVIRDLNREFGYNSSYNKVYLFRKGRHVIFKDHPNWEKRSYLFIENSITENDVYDYFHPIMKSYYENNKQRLLEQEEKRIKEEQLKKEHKDKINKLRAQYDIVFQNIEKKINNCKNHLWNMSFDFYEYSSGWWRDEYTITLRLAKYWEKSINFEISEIQDFFKFHMDENLEISLNRFIISKLEKEMNNMINSAFIGKRTVRLMEVK